MATNCRVCVAGVFLYYLCGRAFSVHNCAQGVANREDLHSYWLTAERGPMGMSIFPVFPIRPVPNYTEGLGSAGTYIFLHYKYVPWGAGRGENGISVHFVINVINLHFVVFFRMEPLHLLNLNLSINGK